MQSSCSATFPRLNVHVEPRIHKCKHQINKHKKLSSILRVVDAETSPGVPHVSCLSRRFFSPHNKAKLYLNFSIFATICLAMRSDWR